MKSHFIDPQFKLKKRPKVIRLGVLLLLLIVFSGCSLIQAVEVTPAVLRTPTSLINLTMLPTLPTLGPETVEETPIPDKDIYYDAQSSIFAHFIEQPVPQSPNEAAALRGKVSGGVDSEFKVNAADGTEYTVTCDDYCFAVNDKKEVIGRELITSGSEVIVFGVTDGGKENTLLADVITVNTQKAVERGTVSDMTYLPAEITYTEFELKNAPLSGFNGLTAADGSDISDRIDKRNNTMLSGMTRYSYGVYGEAYSTAIDFKSEFNRDPFHPTRANLTVYSNDYEFMNLWFPAVDNPFFDHSGILNFGGDWFMTIRMTVDINPDPEIAEILYSDRTIMSQLNFDKTYQYVRSFGFSVYDYKLFYFFQRNDGYGFALNRVDYNLGFDEILYGLVDEYQDLNPYYSDNLITFFARRGQSWYLVELETPKKPYY
jgi:hypothetical protein